MTKKQSKFANCGADNGNWKHGLKGSELYWRWVGMRGRCENPKNNSYRFYGKKGIKVCSRWDDFKNFNDDMLPNYLIHVEKYGKKNTSIDRINSKKDYSPENCRWATPKQQSCRTSRVVLVKYKGEIKNIAEWAKYFNINYTTMYQRYKRYGRLTILK